MSSTGVHTHWGARSTKTQLVIAVTSCEANGVKAFSEYEVSKILLTLTQGKNRREEEEKNHRQNEKV